MKERKYPAGLFWIGFITNIMFHFLYLFVPALICLFVGIWIRVCLYIGLGLLMLDIILSLIEQLRIRQAMLSDSDNPDFTAFQDSVVTEGNWMDNVHNFAEGKKNDREIETKDDK